MKQVTILGGLLAASMVGSYLTWTSEEDTQKETEVLALQATTDSLTSIVWEDEEDTVTITRVSDEAGRWIQIEHVERKTVAPAQPAEDVPDETPSEAPEQGAEEVEDAAAEPEIETTTTRFAGNEQAQILWDSFAPLYALRELATPSPDALPSFGLDEPEASLQVTVDNRTSAIEVGGSSYGTRDRYVRLEDRVFLLDSKLLRSLQAANTRLVERRLHPLTEGDLVSLELTRGADLRVWAHQNREDSKNRYWSPADSPEQRAVSAATWIDKLLKLRVKGYIDPLALPDDAKPLFTYVVTGTDASWPVQVTFAETDGETTYYATSSFTRATTELTRTVAQNAIADLDTLFDEDAEEEEPSAQDEAQAVEAP
jgi:hypothetical protein